MAKGEGVIRFISILICNLFLKQECYLVSCSLQCTYFMLRYYIYTYIYVGFFEGNLLDLSCLNLFETHFFIAFLFHVIHTYKPLCKGLPLVRMQSAVIWILLWEFSSQVYILIQSFGTLEEQEQSQWWKQKKKELKQLSSLWLINSEIRRLRDWL